MFKFIVLIIIVSSAAVVFEKILDSDSKSFAIKSNNSIYVLPESFVEPLIISNTDELSLNFYFEKATIGLNCVLNISLARGFVSYNVFKQTNTNFLAATSVKSCNNKVNRISAKNISNDTKLTSKCFNGNNVTVSAISQNAHTLWLRLNDLVTFSQKSTYPAYQHPEGTTEFLLQSKDFVIDASPFRGQMYEFYKMAQRPIQTLELKPSSNCTDVTLNFEFDDQCKVSIHHLADDVEVVVDGKSFLFGYRPNQTILTFTYTAAFLYTFGPFGLKRIDGCKFDVNHASNTEYNLNMWYTADDVLCSAPKLIFLDPVAIRKTLRKTSVVTDATMLTTPTMITAATEFATMSINVPETMKASSAKVNVWFIVGPICGVILLIIVIGIIAGLCWLSHKNKKHVNIEKKKSTPKPAKKNSGRKTKKQRRLSNDAPQHSVNAPVAPISVIQPSITAAVSALSAPPQITPVQPPKTSKKAKRILKSKSKKSVPKVIESVAPTQTSSLITAKDDSTILVNYHEGEPAVLANHQCPINNMIVKHGIYSNFWDIINLPFDDGIFWRQIYIDDKNLMFDNCWVYRYDLTTMPSSPFNLLANRLLGPHPVSLPHNNDQPTFAVRVFITSKKPLTVEVYAYDVCPHFFFDICKCRLCDIHGIEYKAGNKRQGMCIDSWETFACRVKRLPTSHHYFATLEDPRQKNRFIYALFIRGSGYQEYGACMKGCNIDSPAIHPSTERYRIADPTDVTQSEGMYPR